ncbi:MAG: NADH-quinone oxidoreductase subunit NuoH [Anaerolineae bacterium]|nr:NADH-quinone oxidoreductase subunit NuoH [Anaerolineae bacterium]
MDPIKLLESTLSLAPFEYLREVWVAAGMNPALAKVITDVIGVVILASFCLLIVLFLIWLERKVLARMQDRIGPNRVGGKFGLLQTLADALKLVSKEAITPAGADKIAFNLAPILMVMTALLMWAVIPFAPGVIGSDLNIGLFYILAVSSASVVCLLLAGWGSNNKYALLGAFRAVAQMVSYEVPMVLSLLVPLILARSMQMGEIIAAQTIPFLILAPISALIFFISALAETGRTPFDLLEAESEIIAGFHIEYGGMKWSMFMLAEFVGTLFMSALFTTVYLGGWRFFGVENVVLGNIQIGNLLAMLVFFLKTFAVFMVFIWIRGTLPRVRIDQLLDFNWKFLVPLTIVLTMMVVILDKVLELNGIAGWNRAIVHLISNVVLAFITLELLRRRGRQIREEMEGSRQAGPDDHHDADGHGHEADHGHGHELAHAAGD